MCNLRIIKKWINIYTVAHQFISSFNINFMILHYFLYSIDFCRFYDNFLVIVSTPAPVTLTERRRRRKKKTHFPYQRPWLRRIFVFDWLVPRMERRHRETETVSRGSLEEVSLSTGARKNAYLVIQISSWCSRRIKYLLRVSTFRGSLRERKGFLAETEGPVSPPRVKAPHPRCCRIPGTLSTFRALCFSLVVIPYCHPE